MNQRYELIMSQFPDLTGQSILDVGTGSGRYAVELAARGAKVTGVDFSSEMLVLAQEAAKQREVQLRCRWLQGDFLALRELDSHYDVSLAIGFFDYIMDPRPLLVRMSELTGRTLIASFPKRWTSRTLPRKLRLALNGCYVRFYSRGEIERLMRSLNRSPRTVQVLSVNRDYIVRADFT